MRLTAPPVEGRANDSLRRLLAEHLNVPVSAVRIVAGENSRNKRVSIAGVSRTAGAGALRISREYRREAQRLISCRTSKRSNPNCARTKSTAGSFTTITIAIPSPATSSASTATRWSRAAGFTSSPPRASRASWCTRSSRALSIRSTARSFSTPAGKSCTRRCLNCSQAVKTSRCSIRPKIIFPTSAWWTPAPSS